jgi:glycosyltransferase involved in cell wall biosynthesis
MAEKKRDFTVLMVSTEYPPMQGGIGRYTYNLVKSLRARDIDIKVISNSDGLGDYSGLSPSSTTNSEVLYKLVRTLQPDIVHIQHEPGLLGFDLKLHPLFPNRTKTGLDEFYSVCRVPVVTTFHTAFKFKQWMQYTVVNGKDTLHTRSLYKYWKQLINYSSLRKTISYAMSKSSAGIVLSNYLKSLIPGARVIYHGAEPFQSIQIEQKEARKRLSLPQNERIALVQGFLTAPKGWNMIRKMHIPDGWKLVINYSRDHYNNQMIDLRLNNRKNIINFEKGYLSDKDLSMIFFASDIVFLPYKAISGSGIMFDGLAHGKPFLASDIGFFEEFSKLNLGIVTRRNAASFEEGLKIVDKNYEMLKSNVEQFRKKLKWDHIAKQHMEIYRTVIDDKSMDVK